MESAKGSRFENRAPAIAGIVWRETTPDVYAVGWGASGIPTPPLQPYLFYLDLMFHCRGCQVRG